LQWHTEKRRISDLIPLDANPRILTEKQAKDLEKSLKKFNLAEIPAINTDNTILAGHQRLKILATIVQENVEIDVRVPDRRLSPKECREYCVRSNKNTGAWDWNSLANNYDAADLLDWGFTEEDLGGDAFDTEPEHETVTKEAFSVVITCNDSAHQLQVLEECRKNGWAATARP